MTLAFATGAALPIRTRNPSSTTTPRMKDDASGVVDKYYPVYQRHRAPVITIDGQQGVSLAMPRLQAFAELEKEDTAPLFNYQPDDVFVPNKPVPPSPISWPAGDGRGNEFIGTKGSFNQADLKTYGPFPDFFKRSCDG